MQQPSTLVICCGAVAREVLAVIDENGWDHMRVECLPAKLHNDPAKLPEGVRAKIREGRRRFDNILVLYSDCGTGGRMDKVLEEEGVDGIGGAHCYEVFAGSRAFRNMVADEKGCFFVTDFLARHFDKLVYKGLGLDRFPKLRKAYFGKYSKLVYLAQRNDPDLMARARAAAESVGLAFEVRHTGYGGFQEFLSSRGVQPR
jgi:hypothetical protein